MNILLSLTYCIPPKLTHIYYYSFSLKTFTSFGMIYSRDPQVYYHIFDEEAPGDADEIALTRAEVDFSEQYHRNTGRKWRQYFGRNGARPPPVLHMWPADTVGQQHGVFTTHGYWYE